MSQNYPYLSMYKDDNSGVAVEHRIHSWSVGMHKHQYCELILVDRGSMRHAYNSVETLLIPGDIVIIGKECEHGYLLSGEVSIYNCQFMQNALDPKVIQNIASVGLLENQDRILNDQPFTQAIIATKTNIGSEDLPHYSANSGKQGVVHLSPGEKAYFIELLHHMMEEQDSSKPNPLIKLKYMEIILMELTKKVQHLNRGVTSFSPENQKTIANMLADMESDITKPFDIQEMSNKFSFTPNYLRKIFKDFTGTTPVQYLNRIRCMRASELIQNGMNATSAAEAVGFYDISYFSKVFKKHIGCSPNKFV